MARLIKTEVKSNVSMVSNFIHDDESVEQVTCKVGDKVSVSYVLNEEVKEVTGKITSIKLGKGRFNKGDQVQFNNVPLYKDPNTRSVSYRRNGSFYIWGGDIQNGRIRVTNLKSNVGKVNQISGWVEMDDIVYGKGYDFNNEVKPITITVDASTEYNSCVEEISVFEIVELSVVEEAKEEEVDNPPEQVTE